LEVIRGRCRIVSERALSSTAGFAKTVERAGAETGFDFKAHPHMLRHAQQRVYQKLGKAGREHDWISVY
jgi:hypothetical protein